MTEWRSEESAINSSSSGDSRQKPDTTPTKPAPSNARSISPTPVLIDCDPGMDDALALIVALKCAHLRVCAITSVSGNLPAARCYQNIHTILHLMRVPALGVPATAGGPGLPTGQGAPQPLVRELAHDPFSHGADGLGETDLRAAPLPATPAYAPSLLVEQARRQAQDDDPLTVVALGPLTNLALALQMEPRLPQLIRRLIILGGAFGLQREAALNATGDNPVSEWNIYVDPEAARRVLHAGFDLVAVGLDVATHRDIRLTPADETRLRAADLPEAQLACGMLDFVTGRGFPSYCVLIDSCAVAAAAHPDLIETVPLHCDVETTGELTRGQTVTDIRDNFRWHHLPQLHAARDADFPALRRFILDTLLAR